MVRSVQSRPAFFVRRWCVLSGVALLAGCQSAGPAAGPSPGVTRVDFIPIVITLGPQPLAQPYHIFYGMLAHSSGKVYLGTCYDVARLIECDPVTRISRVVAVMSSHARDGGGPDLPNPTLRGDRGPGPFPQTNWVHSQAKIHAQLHEGRDGRVYGATHVKVEDPDSTRNYPGGHWFAYDPATSRTEDLGWSRRHEGIITACMDRQRNILYGISWPTGYLFRCRPDAADYRDRLTILGLTSSHIDSSPRWMGVVRSGRVYAQDGATGEILVYEPGTSRIRRVAGLTTPAEPRRAAATGPDRQTLPASPSWRNWWIEGTVSPDGNRLFLTSQRAGHLVEIDSTRGRWGEVIDHGRTVPWGPYDWSGPYCGIMVFGRDGLLYHTVGKQLLSFEPKSGRVLDWGRTVGRDKPNKPIALHGGGSLGPDGRIYAVATRDEITGLAVLDPQSLTGRTGSLLRVSPRRITRPHEQWDD